MVVEFLHGKFMNYLFWWLAIFIILSFGAQMNIVGEFFKPLRDLYLRASKKVAVQVASWLFRITGQFIVWALRFSWWLAGVIVMHAPWVVACIRAHRAHAPMPQRPGPFAPVPGWPRGTHNNTH